MKNHPFTDGNKRVAFTITDIFLKINGYKLIIGSDKIYKEIMRILDKDEETFNISNTWLNKNTKKN